MSWKNLFSFLRWPDHDRAHQQDMATWFDSPNRPQALTLVPEHVHQWKKAFSTYAPPRRDFTNVDNLDLQVLSSVLLGITCVLWECLECHQRTREEFLGSDVTQLDDLLDRVEAFGVQYYNRNGTLFQVQRYQVQPPANTLPIR